jgi:hypothetical protein
MNRNLAIISPITCLAACTTTEQVVFVTESSLSIANIEAMPAEITVGFDRVEGYFTPAYSNSALPPVVSSIKTDGVTCANDPTTVCDGSSRKPGGHG